MSRTDDIDLTVSGLHVGPRCAEPLMDRELTGRARIPWISPIPTRRRFSRTFSLPGC